MTAILTHVTPDGEEHPLLPFAKLQGNFSDHQVMFDLPWQLVNNMTAMEANGMMDLTKYNFVFIHEFRRWDDRVGDETFNDVSITMFGSNENLAIRNIKSPDEGYSYSFEENGGLDGSVWGLTHHDGQPLIQSISRSPGPYVKPGYLIQAFDHILNGMKKQARG